MEEIEKIGILSKKIDKYFLTTDDGIIYTLYAILPWESVPIDFDTAKFSKFIGEKVKVIGTSSGTEIWNALVHRLDGSDTKPPFIDDLLEKEDKRKKKR
ncbi:MAG: hypothetical protein FK730_09900 [Asgard group archaeon]|nr:hypothetical protein [Asgard group archaeon]